MRKTAFIVAILFVMATLPTRAFAQGTPHTALHSINNALSGSLTFVPYGPGPFDVNTIGVASGPVQGLGLTNVFTFHQPTADGSGVVNGRFFMVAANGDQIKGTYEGTNELGEPGQLIGRASWVITGGTGRFANASGTINATAYVTFLGFETFEWPVVWVLEGTINY